MCTEGHRSQIVPQLSMHAAIEAALLKLSFVFKNHKNLESTSSQVQMFTALNLREKKINLFQLLKNTKEVEGSRTKRPRL